MSKLKLAPFLSWFFTHLEHELYFIQTCLPTAAQARIILLPFPTLAAVCLNPSPLSPSKTLSRLLMLPTAREHATAYQLHVWPVFRYVGQLLQCNRCKKRGWSIWIYRRTAELRAWRSSHGLELWKSSRNGYSQRGKSMPHFLSYSPVILWFSIGRDSGRSWLRWWHWRLPRCW